MGRIKIKQKNKNKERSNKNRKKLKFRKSKKKRENKIALNTIIRKFIKNLSKLIIKQNKNKWNCFQIKKKILIIQNYF